MQPRGDPAYCVDLHGAGSRMQLPKVDINEEQPPAALHNYSKRINAVQFWVAEGARVDEIISRL